MLRGKKHNELSAAHIFDKGDLWPSIMFIIGLKGDTSTNSFSYFNDFEFVSDLGDGMLICGNVPLKLWLPVRFKFDPLLRFQSNLIHVLVIQARISWKSSAVVALNFYVAMPLSERSCCSSQRANKEIFKET